jgi:hypothetical protein
VRGERRFGEATIAVLALLGGAFGGSVGVFITERGADRRAELEAERYVREEERVVQQEERAATDAFLVEVLDARDAAGTEAFPGQLGRLDRATVAFLVTVPSRAGCSTNVRSLLLGLDRSVTVARDTGAGPSSADPVREMLDQEVERFATGQLCTPEADLLVPAPELGPRVTAPGSG